MLTITSTLLLAVAATLLPSAAVAQSTQDIITGINAAISTLPPCVSTCLAQQSVSLPQQVTAENLLQVCTLNIQQESLTACVLADATCSSERGSIFTGFTTVVALCSAVTSSSASGTAAASASVSETSTASVPLLTTTSMVLSGTRAATVTSGVSILTSRAPGASSTAATTPSGAVGSAAGGVAGVFAALLGVAAVAALA
ncbi:hypothetical protein HDU67_007445 [Dinochytrium kinnereticum]|nr:hypothetical protein HDU67_007445 [Dinochytrium kinnereticum]